MWGFSKLSLISFALFSGNQVLERFIKIPFVHAYLDDLLCAPIVMGMALWVFQKLILQDSHFVFHWSFGLIFIAFYTLLFEGLFPLYDARHFADGWDILAYGLGTLLFFGWGNRPAPEKEEQAGNILKS